MSHDVDAIYHAGVFQPLEPLPLTEGTRVHLRVELQQAESTAQNVARLHSPRLAHPDQMADFQMEVAAARL